ncbi:MULTISPECIES: hypothetical protein [Hymenobacter]|uniref:STAS/SEC14 domain-containing protein n=1 Tax=Hymenobacter armeniacus TaxID=2771358 RepID=A0ABR8JXL3_9BACT|nr:MULTISPECIES: hypothetical protein [Hymenobacter]MBD2723830.1 hypothetical protein [Hymenobacter armeniacus]MBJ6107910.1 hypothetical protein [Hymenobacter sp. BT523]
MNQTALPLLFENTAGQLQADPAGFLRATWGPRRRTLAETQALFNQMLRCLQQHGWGRILINQLTMPPFSPTEQQWIAQHWLPRAVTEGGYRYGAVVVSPDVLVRLATAFVTTSVQGLPLTYRSFDTDAAATAWLAQQPA